jgi:hypothetical protein
MSTMLAGPGPPSGDRRRVAPIPCAARRSATCRPSFAIGPTVTISTSRCAASRSTSTPSSVRRSASNSVADTPLGEPQHGRAVVRPATASAELLAQAGGVARRRQADARDDLEDGEVPHAVVAGPVRSGVTPARSSTNVTTRAVEGDIHQHLIERTVHERRVERDHRVQPAEGEPGGAGHRVLLGDADVEDPIGMLLRERADPSGAAWRP